MEMLHFGGQKIVKALQQQQQQQTIYISSSSWVSQT